LDVVLRKGTVAGTKTNKSGKGSAAKRGSARNGSNPRPGDYAREALAEWRKAARFGATALLASRRSAAEAGKKPPLKERLNPANTEKGGRIGDALDGLLSKLGFLGKSASKLSLGSRAVHKLRPDLLDKLQPAGADADDEESGGGRPEPAAGGGVGGGDHVPIQESIEVAVPLAAAFSLATRFQDYPEFSERITGAEEIDDTHVTFDATLHGRSRTIEIEILEESPDRRVAWEAVDGIEHSGVATFHELAPSLTHVELSIEVEPEGLIPRLTRSIHLPDRAVREELHRFKAYAELWQDVEDVEPPEDSESEPEEEDEEISDQELEDEEEPEDEYEEEPEDEYEDEYEEEPEDEYEDEAGEDTEFEDDEDYEEEDELEEEVEPAGAR
jgi:uncharacterized membrane protein